MVGQESPSFPMTVAANAVVSNETTVKVLPVAKHKFPQDLNGSQPI